MYVCLFPWLWSRITYCFIIHWFTLKTEGDHFSVPLSIYQSTPLFFMAAWYSILWMNHELLFDLILIFPVLFCATINSGQWASLQKAVLTLLVISIGQIPKSEIADSMSIKHISQCWEALEHLKTWRGGWEVYSLHSRPFIWH